MARNWYGEKKIIKDDMYLRKYAKESDILWEKIKMVLKEQINYTLNKKKQKKYINKYLFFN